MSDLTQVQYFLDSSFMVALLDESDVWHARAQQVYAENNLDEAQLFYSDVMINEVLSALGRRCRQKKKLFNSYKKLSRNLSAVLQGSPILCLYQIVPTYLKRIIDMMSVHHGQLSFHDCLIVFFLREVPQVYLLSFDKGFDKIKKINRKS